MSKDKAISSYARLLRQLNDELASRFDALPPDVQALLVQKGAVSQRAASEMGALLAESAQHLALYDQLLDRIAEWRAEFLLPLQEQSDDERIEDPVNTEDLAKVISEADALLKAAGRRV